MTHCSRADDSTHVAPKSGATTTATLDQQQADAGKVAETTLRCLRRAVSAAVPGIVFLSGGQGDVAGAQAALRYRARCNNLAVHGKYSARAESANLVCK